MYRIDTIFLILKSTTTYISRLGKQFLKHGSTHFSVFKRVHEDKYVRRALIIGQKNSGVKGNTYKRLNTCLCYYICMTSKWHNYRNWQSNLFQTNSESSSFGWFQRHHHYAQFKYGDEFQLLKLKMSTRFTTYSCLSDFAFAIKRSR